MPGHPRRRVLRLTRCIVTMLFQREPQSSRLRRASSPLLMASAVLSASEAHAQASAAALNSGDTAWMLMASALVLLMTPGLALFYGGMVRRKNVLSTFMYSFFTMALVTIQWVVVGYSLAFGTSQGGFI